MFRTITAPTAEPVTLAEAKAHLRYETSDEDALITALIQAAREKVEAHTDRALMVQTVVQVYESWNDAITLEDGTQYFELWKCPVQSVASFKYTKSEDDTVVTIDSTTYIVNTAFEPARLHMKNGECFPSVATEMGTIEIQYQCGYSSASDVPAAIKQAMLLMISHWFENRQDHVKNMPFASECLLRPYKIY